MLRLMRNNAGSWIIKVLLALIVIVFIFLGIGPDDKQGNTIAATVNKTEISMSDYQRAYSNLVAMYKNYLGGNVSEELIKGFGLKEKALESLIQRALILQTCDKLNLSTTQEELVAYLTSIPVFQKNGSFSQENYNNYLKYTRQPANHFEAQQCEEIVSGKFKALLSETVQVSDIELQEWFLWEKTQASIDYKLFSPASYKDIIPSPEQVSAYYDDHKNEHKSSPQVQVTYLVFSPENYKKAVTIADDKITEYYTNNQAKYHSEKTVEARHILIKVAENADAIAVEAARVKAQTIYEKAVNKQDFGELARQFSQDSSREQGGRLGVFTKKQMVKPFSEKAFSMNAGEISEPVKTQFGWHIIKVEHVNEASTKKFEAVKEEIREALIKEQGEIIAYEASEDAFRTIIDGEELATIAATQKLNLVKTEAFTQNIGPMEVPANQRWDFAKAVFNMEEKEISDVLEFKGHYYIVQMDKKQPAEVQPLESIKKRIEEQVTQKLRLEKAEKDATELLTALSNDPEKLKEIKGLQATGFFNRTDNASKLEIDSKVISDAFQLTEKNPFPKEPIKGEKGYYVIMLKGKKMPELSELDKEKEKLKSQVTQKKKSMTFNQWLTQVKNNSKIEKNSQFFN